MARLSSVLDVDDLPAAELEAMRLDGQLFRFAGAWCPVDAPDTPELRARAIMSGRSRRLVAELRTAAWIWGALDATPIPLELCADVRARARSRPGADAVVREVVLSDDDVVRFGDAAVTAPLRTAVDLARAEGDPACVRRLGKIGNFDRAAALASLEARTLPGRRIASRILGETLI
jgi:hypothetical protein